MRNKIQTINVTPRFFILIAAGFLLFPLNWLIAWFIAVVVHESAHCLAITICGCKIHRISLDVTGAEIHTDLLTNLQTIFCALAGPACGLLLLFFTQKYPQLALCSLIQSLYNLLPIYPLDGGRILDSLTSLLFSRNTAYRICNVISILTMILILWLSIAVSILLNTCSPMLIPAILFLQHRRK